jgi:hypothetical protein
LKHDPILILNFIFGSIILLQKYRESLFGTKYPQERRYSGRTLFETAVYKGESFRREVYSGRTFRRAVYSGRTFR